MSKPVYSDGKVHVMSAQCETCVFRPGNRMNLPPGRLSKMVASTLRVDGGNIPCHHTTYGQAPTEAICRGWWDHYAAESNLLRMAMRLGIVEEISTE